MPPDSARGYAPGLLEHPKALVPVGGIPMLERVIIKLRDEGFCRIVVNVHHFAGQVKDFLSSRSFGVEIAVSDESESLLDTGGAIVKAARCSVMTAARYSFTMWT